MTRSELLRGGLPGRRCASLPEIQTARKPANRNGAVRPQTCGNPSLWLAPVRAIYLTGIVDNLVELAIVGDDPKKTKRTLE